MPDTLNRSPGLNPVHAILLAFPVALFITGLATDIAYLRTQELQWTNFSSWLIAGGVLFTGLVLAWALVAVVRTLRRGDGSRRIIYASVLAALLVVGLLNAFQHSRDGWSSVGAFGLILSVVSAALALLAALIAHTGLFSEEVAR